MKTVRHPLDCPFRHAFACKGGGGGGTPPPPTPPVTERSTEVTAASRQARSDAAKRKGYQATLLAGETGGYNDQQGQKTLLGS